MNVEKEGKREGVRANKEHKQAICAHKKYANTFNK